MFFCLSICMLSITTVQAKHCTPPPCAADSPQVVNPYKIQDPSKKFWQSIKQKYPSVKEKTTQEVKKDVQYVKQKTREVYQKYKKKYCQCN